MRRPLFGFLAVALSACSLDIAGVTEDDPIDAAEPVDAGSPSDAGALPETSPVDATPPDAALCNPDASPNGTDCFNLPAGWTAVAFEPTRTAACSSIGFTSTDVFETATAGATSCGCGACSLSTAPSCTGGKAVLSFDADAGVGCGTAGDPSKLSNNPAGQCATDVQGGVNPTMLDVKIAPPDPVGGSCVAPGVIHKENVTFGAQGRVCAPTDPAWIGCVGQACAPNVPLPFHACLEMAGNQACPSPFTVKHVVGSDVSFDCGQCSCGLNASCTGTLTFYTDTVCGANPVALAADKVCRAASALSGNTYGSYKYVGSVAASTCGVAGPSAAAANLAIIGTSTICCAP